MVGSVGVVDEGLWGGGHLGFRVLLQICWALGRGGDFGVQSSEGRSFVSWSKTLLTRSSEKKLCSLHFRL